ncbi:MAG: protein BatD, partial [Aequorivita sp.]|nr:protein BatD [Aequorivita sp.]
MKTKSFLFLLGFVLCSIAATAQVQFDAKVSKKRLGINERLRIDFEMNQDGDNFRPPSFDGFRVVGGPNQSISNSWINGKRSFSKTYSYFLAPQTRGKITIAQATIEIEGETYKTLPVEVEVTAAVDVPKDGNNADYVASENVHLVAEVSKANPYLNEAITVTYKLYVSHDVSITSQWREIDTPKYADFWSQNIDNQNNFKVYEGKYNGQDYRYVVLRTTVLYPQKTGELEIEPLTLDIPIDVQGNRRDIFGRRVMERVNKTISAGKRTINVKPLPLEGKPDGFNGAVGDFTFDVNTNKTQLNANESLQLDVKVSGKGNLKLFTLPTVKLPNTLEVYEPEHSESVNTTIGGMSGSITDSYTVVPQFKGTYPVNPITFSFFDPKTEKYRTITSKEFTIEVENGPISSANPIANSNDA